MNERLASRTCVSRVWRSLSKHREAAQRSPSVLDVILEEVGIQELEPDRPKKSPGHKYVHV